MTTQNIKAEIRKLENAIRGHASRDPQKWRDDIEELKNELARLKDDLGGYGMAQAKGEFK